MTDTSTKVRTGYAGLIALGSFLVASGCGTTGNELGNLSAEADHPIAAVPRAGHDAHLQQACGASDVTSTGERLLPRWPYLQKVTDHSATMVWVGTDAKAVLEVTTPDGAKVASVTGAPDTSARPTKGTQFTADIDALAPASIYCWTLSGADGKPWATAGFSTAPSADTTAPVRFAAMGDLGKRSSDQLAVLAQLERVRSDFVLLTGDVAYDNGTRGDLERNVFSVYREMMGEVPFFPASGNHDYSTDDAKPFREAFALFENGGTEGRERWYSFDWGPLHTIVLDTEKIGDTQRKWLEDELAMNELPFTVVVLHRPPFSSGSHGSDGDVRSTFVPLFEDYGVDLVLCGHDHDYERTESIGGVTYVVTGGGGRGTRPVGESDFTAYSAEVAHFVYVTIENDELYLVAIDGRGNPFDDVRIRAD